MISRGGWAYMLLGIGLGVGAVCAYQQYANGNIQRMMSNIGNNIGNMGNTGNKSTTGNRSQTQNKLGNMM